MAGKPLTDARREVGRAIQTFSIAAEEAKRIGGEVVPLDWSPGMESYWGVTRRFPIGPILGITPFNFPLNLVVHKVAPALAAGNSILIKPAPQAPLTSLLLAELLLEAGVPAGGLNVLPCENKVAEQLVVDPRFKLLSFTGSAPVGWMLKAKCGKKKVVLELGGNAAVIVEPDADLDHVAQRCVTGGFSYAGQRYDECGVHTERCGARSRHRDLDVDDCRQRILQRRERCGDLHDHADTDRQRWC